MKSKERLVGRGLQRVLGREERSAGGHAAACNPAESGTVQAVAADPPFSGEGTTMEKRSVRKLLCSLLETRKCCQKLSLSRKDFVLQAEICWDKDG